MLRFPAARRPEARPPLHHGAGAQVESRSGITGSWVAGGSASSEGFLASAWTLWPRC